MVDYLDWSILSPDDSSDANDTFFHELNAFASDYFDQVASDTCIVSSPGELLSTPFSTGELSEKAELESSNTVDGPRRECSTQEQALCSDEYSQPVVHQAASNYAEDDPLSPVQNANYFPSAQFGISPRLTSFS